jgi:hypothetical protein
LEAAAAADDPLLRPPVLLLRPAILSGVLPYGSGYPPLPSPLSLSLVLSRVRVS